MTPEVLIAVAAWVQAIAAVAMWKATVNLVRTSRDMILANVPPQIRVRLQNSQPFDAPKDSTVTVTNDGSIDWSNVILDVGPSFESDDCKAHSKITSTFRVGTLRAGRDYKFQLWDFAKAAAYKQQQLPEEFSHARDAPNAQVEVVLSFKHSATGARHESTHFFLTEFSSTGQLCACYWFPRTERYGQTGTDR